MKVTREELQSTIAQLEGSNDQLKASNEEVTAANEELQSANEELETSKEELQSLNEELNTINARLEDKVEELEGVNNDLLNLLESTAIATVFLDKELKVKRYTPASTRLFSLIPSDLTRPIADILRRFEDETLFGDAARVLADLTPLAKEVQAEDGRWYIRRMAYAIALRTTGSRDRHHLCGCLRYQENRGGAARSAPAGRMAGQDAGGEPQPGRARVGRRIHALCQPRGLANARLAMAGRPPRSRAVAGHGHPGRGRGETHRGGRGARREAF